jgi:site-specific DNA-methyltransferase (cytosine-N4-specific)
MRVAGHFRGRRYQPGLQLRISDARDLPRAMEPADLILTSPPYGDNHTTMPYGQASFLALCWIDHADIGSPIPSELLASSRSLDTASLGGSRRTADPAVARSLAERSPALASVLGDLEALSQEAWRRVAAFFIDYDHAWASILAVAANDAHLVLTLGDRTVRGHGVPTAQITQELLEARGAVLLERLHRRIPHNKRLARRNEAAETISTETVLIMQRT